jgi:D-psicose/D-tagatose/L-ribulose 3-epimerase
VSNNPVGIHYQVFTSVWQGAEMDRTARRAADAGFDFLELTCIDADGFDVKGTQAVLSACGIGAMLSTAMLPENDVASPDRTISTLGEEHLMRTLEIASELEAPWLVGLTHSAWAKASEAPTAAGRANSVDALRRVTARAEELGVAMGLEVVNRFENNVLNTAAQARAFIDDVGSPQLHIHLDSYHAHLEEAGQAEAVEACGDRLGYVHFGESHRGRLGAGSVDFAAYAGAVVASGFDGPVAFEAFSPNIVGDEFAPLLCLWREQWQDSDAVAAHAREFIAQRIT